MLPTKSRYGSLSLFELEIKSIGIFKANINLHSDIQVNILIQVEKLEKSLQETFDCFPVEINEFHVSPQVNPKNGLPFHEWSIEFESFPENMGKFTKLLDDNLQKLNVYYKDLIVGNVLSPLKVVKIKKGGFQNYMKSIGKLGGQNKSPRLANDRKIADKLKIFIVDGN